MGDFSEVHVKVASNGWILTARGEDGEEIEVYEYFPEEVDFGCLENNYVEQLPAFAAMLRSLATKVGPALNEKSPQRLEIKVRKRTARELQEEQKTEKSEE